MIDTKDLSIEIVNTNQIVGGIEIFARAWINNQQIGFGKDGSVDIERFRIFNPPVLVPDQNGSISITSPADPITGAPAITTNYSEDVTQATLQVIESAIQISPEVFPNSQSIVPGKIGNTTDTFYSAGGDGVLEYNGGGSASWSTMHNASASTNVSYTTASGWGFVARNLYYLYRGVFPFDTSSIPAGDTITSATLSFVPSASYNDFCGFTTYLCPISLASTSSLVTGDFGGITFTDYGNASWSGATVGSYYSINLNSTGLVNINKAGFTELALISDSDFNNTAPCSSTQTGGGQIYYSEQTGTTQDPKLVITHSSGATYTPGPMMHLMQM